MLKLEKLRFINIGAPDCRMRDLTLSTVDEHGEPEDTVVWLRNGGGKTALLGLFFAHLLPDAREFLRGRKENAKFADHVLDGDTSYVLASWVGEARALDLFGAGGPRLVTGRVVERKPGFAGTSLPGVFFSFRPVPGVLDIDSVPWQLAGQRLSLATFDAEMHRIFRTHPEVDFSATEKQSQWASRLRDLGLDPQVFRYQRQMNAGEGEAASGFMQFRTSDEFVDFLVGVVTPAAKIESLEVEIRRFSEKLRRLPDFKLELDLIEQAVPLLTTHAEHLRTKEDLEQGRADLMAHGVLFRERLAAGVLQAREQARQACEALERLDKEGASVRERRQVLQVELREVDYRLARFAEEAAQTALREASANREASGKARAAWLLTDPLARLQRLQVQRLELAQLLERRSTEAAPLLRDQQQAGAALRWRLLATAAELDLAAEQNDTAAQDRQAGADARQADADRLRDELASLRHQVADAEKALREIERARKTLRGDGRLLLQESARDAVARWRQEESRVNARLDEIRSDYPRLTQETGDLHDQEIGWTRRAASQTAEAARLRARQREIEEHRRQLWVSEEIRSVVEVDEPDLWQECAAIDRALRGRWLEIVNEQVATSARSEEDRRVCASVEARGTLPPSLDAEQALRMLREAGITSAYHGWDFLRNAPDAEAAARILLRAPELAAGILLNDASQLEQARTLLAAAGFQPTTVMAVGVAEGFERAAGEGQGYLWPPHAGLYDPEAARAEQERAATRVEASGQRRKDLHAAAEAVGAAREQLRSFVEAYPAGERERAIERAQAIEAEVADLERRQSSAATRREEIARRLDALQVERGDLNRRLGRIPGIITALTALAEQEESEITWRRLAADGPAQAADLDRQRHQEIDTRRRQVEERDRLIKTAERQRLEAERFREEMGGLPDVDFPDELRAWPAESLRERYRTLSRAYEEQLGRDAILADLKRVEDALAEVEPRIQAAAEEVRAAALRLLASADGQSETSRHAALAAAEAELNAAVGAEALAGQAATERRNERVKAEESRNQAPRDDLAVASAAAGEKLRRSLVERERESEREENTINAQYGVFKPRLDQANQRAGRLQAAQKLVSTAIDEDLHDVPGDAEPFAGTEQEADTEADAFVSGVKRAKRELDSARSQASESAGELRALAEQEQFKRLGPAITLRLSQPGGKAEAVGELAAEIERRLPGLRADIDSAESDRRMVLAGLILAAKDSFRDLRHIQEASKLPAGLDAWSGVPFIQIHFDAPHGEDEWELRLGGVLEDWVNRQDMPANSGLSILRQAVRAANGRGVARAAGAGEGLPRSSFNVTLLKPDAILTTQRYSVEAMKFSEGQDLTTAILLYCTFINLRVRRGGDPGGGAGALVLDNPIGKASLDKLIELQRKVAEIMKVQIIATTGVKDREAISHYPKIVGIRPVRTRDARMKYLQASDDPMELGSLNAAELIVKQAT